MFDATYTLNLVGFLNELVYAVGGRLRGTARLGVVVHVSGCLHLLKTYFYKADKILN